MPRIEFQNTTQAETYLKYNIKNSDKNYSIFIDSKNQAILVPGKSTQPIIYILIENCNAENLRDILPEMPIYLIKHFEWDAQHVPMGD